MNNQFFSPQRFWSYFKYDLIQLWRNHMKAAVGIGLAGLIAYIVTVTFNLIFDSTWSGPGVTARFSIFFIAFTVLELYQTRTYGYLTDKKQGSAWLMMPASTFEKWLSMILITIIILPAIFLVVSLLVDGFLSLVDPTVGSSMLASLDHGLQELGGGLVEINNEYSTTWSMGAFIPLLYVSMCLNFLFFLLCGLIFKKNKIVWAFVIIFVISTVLSILSISFDLNVDVADDFATAEQQIRHFLCSSTAILALVAAGLAGGIFYRLKTLKH